MLPCHQTAQAASKLADNHATEAARAHCKQAEKLEEAIRHLAEHHAKLQMAEKQLEELKHKLLVTLVLSCSCHDRQPHEQTNR